MEKIKVRIRKKDLRRKIYKMLGEILGSIPEEDKKLLENVRVEVRIGRFKRGYARVCLTEEGIYVIELSRENFEELPENKQKYALAHELAHIVTYEEDRVFGILTPISIELFAEDDAYERLTMDWGFKTPEEEAEE